MFMSTVVYFYLCSVRLNFSMHVSLHFCLVSFTIAHLRILSFVFSHVCVLGRSYTCVVVSCLGSCVVMPCFRVGDQNFFSRIHFCQ